MREITLQELAALAENAKGEIRRIYLHWTAGHYNNTYDDYHLNITGDGTVWSSCGKLTEYKEHTWHRNSGAVAVSICCCADAVAYADGGVDFGSVPPTHIAADPSVQITVTPEEPAATEPTTEPETPAAGAADPAVDTD